MANIADVMGNIRASLNSSIAAGATSLTVDDEFTGKTVAVPGYLAIGEAADYQDMTVEFVRYEGFTRNGDGTSTFSSLTRGIDNTNDQGWNSGVTVGTNIPGELLKRLPAQEEPFDMGNNPVDNVSTLSADIISSPSLIGLRMNWTDDTWEYIDANGDLLGWTPDFTQLSPWNQIRRVNMDAGGNIVATWGDDDYEHAPTDPSVNVIVEIPAFWFDYERFTEGGKTYSEYYVANYNASGLKPFPNVNQGSQPESYLGAYEASAYSPDGGTTWKLASRSGVTPVHGNGDYVGLNGNTLSNLNITEARAYGQNVGSGWQQLTIWGYAAHKLLSMMYLGSMDFQSEIGRGIVDKSSGTDFAGEITGYDNIDAQLSRANLGTATGTGTDGYTPVAVLWGENFWGNIWTFVDGYEAVDSEYRILARDGTWSVVGPPDWGTGDYEVSSASPLADDDGYIDDIEAEELLAILGIPASTAGSSSTYIPDYLWAHDSGENNILRSGGTWATGARAGLACLISARDVAFSLRTLGARLEFIG